MFLLLVIALRYRLGLSYLYLLYPEFGHDGHFFLQESGDGQDNRVAKEKKKGKKKKKKDKKDRKKKKVIHFCISSIFCFDPS